MMTEYAPIPCGLYSELEVLAMRRVRARVLARDDFGLSISLQGTLWTLQTRDRAEYLVLKTLDGGEESVRLDRIETVTTRDGSLVWRQNADEPR